jgi:hypothetical protein
MFSCMAYGSKARDLSKGAPLLCDTQVASVVVDGGVGLKDL